MRPVAGVVRQHPFRPCRPSPRVSFRRVRDDRRVAWGEEDAVGGEPRPRPVAQSRPRPAAGQLAEPRPLIDGIRAAAAGAVPQVVFECRTRVLGSTVRVACVVLPRFCSGGVRKIFSNK